MSRIDKFSAAVSGIWGPIPSAKTMEKQIETLRRLGASEETLRIAEQARRECAQLRLAHVKDRSDLDWIKSERRRALKELAYQLAGLACLWLIATWVLWW